MNRILGLAAALIVSSALSAALPKPSEVSVSNAGPAPVIRWSAVEGAELYRIAVFASPDEEGKRELMAAIWTKGLSWVYGSPKVVAKAGKLPSTRPSKLVPGADYKVMVSAADAGGTNKSDWASAEFTAGKAAAEAPARKSVAPVDLSSTATPSPTAVAPAATPTPSPTVAVDAKGVSGNAELEVDLAAEFKETPEAGEAPKPKPTVTAASEITLESARLALQTGKPEAAEAAYKTLLEKDASSADAWEGLGDALDAQKLKIEAKEAYEKALGLDKTRERLKKWIEENTRR